MKKDRMCQYCKKEFVQIEGRTFSNHVKWCDKRDIQRKLNCQWCKHEVCSNNLEQHESACCENSKNSHKKTNCLECGIAIFNQKFCSHQCSAKYECKNRKESGWKNPLKNVIQPRIDKICICCGNVFKCCMHSHYKVTCDSCLLVDKNCVICNKIFRDKTYNIRKTCSNICSRKLTSNNSRENHNCGGQTNYKKFLYKDQWFDSSWEIILAKLLDEKNIKWIRTKKLCLFWFDEKGKQRRYYPDFYLEKYDLYIDTKNKYLMQQDAYKIEQVRKNNKVNLIVDTLDNIIIQINNIMGDGNA